MGGVSKEMTPGSNFRITSITGSKIGYGETVAGPKGIPHTLKYYFEPTIEIQCEISEQEELPLQEIYDKLSVLVKQAVKKQIAIDKATNKDPQ